MEIREDERIGSIFPLEEQYNMEVSKKQQTTFSLDKSGSRMVAGGFDSVLRYFDFNGLIASDPKPFRQFLPVEGQCINSLSFSPGKSSLVLCVSSDARARIYDRDGNIKSVEETVKGDPYIRMSENALGHTHALTCGEFDPSREDRFLTGSLDSTIRLWDLNSKKVGMDRQLPSLVCFKCVDSKGLSGGGKVSVSSASYSSTDEGHDSAYIVAGCSDGSVQIFNAKKTGVVKHARAEMTLRNAHAGSSEVTDVKVLEKKFKIFTRGFSDGNLKMWDLRFPKKEPVRTWDKIPGAISGSSLALAFSLPSMFANGKDYPLILAGTSDGRLVGIDMEEDERICDIQVTEGNEGIIKTFYHQELKQIFCSTEKGKISMFFSRKTSRNGALLFIDKKFARRKQEKDLEKHLVPLKVFNYDDLIDSGDFRETQSGRLRAALATDLTLRQEKMVGRYYDPSMGFDAFIGYGETKKLGEGEVRANKNDDDLRRILPAEYSHLIQEAYKETQPKPVLDFSLEKSEEDKFLQKKRICPKCGLKICVCGYLRGQVQEENESTKRQKQ